MIHQFIRFIKDSLNFFVYIIILLRTDRLTNPLKKTNAGKTITLLANGPSLKKIIPQLFTAPEFQNTDFVVVNYFANESVFWELKPQHYCLADPMFFKKSHREKDALELYSKLNEVNWNINLYIPENLKKNFRQFSQLKNPYVQVIGINTVAYQGFEVFRNYFYKMGLAMPILYTVAHLGIYIGINSGYSRIRLYGVEHSFLESLCVNEKNQLCNRDRHFYDEGEINLKPIIKNDSMDEIWKIADYLIAISNMFKGHEQLEAYAKFSFVKILNCTKGSYIDSYERE